MSALSPLASLPDVPEEGQLDFFDSTVYKHSLFSLTGAKSFKAPRELKPKEQVTGRFTGVVTGFRGTGFAKNTQEPTMTFEVTADFVELD